MVTYQKREIELKNGCVLFNNVLQWTDGVDVCKRIYEIVLLHNLNVITKRKISLVYYSTM